MRTKEPGGTCKPPRPEGSHRHRSRTKDSENLLISGDPSPHELPSAEESSLGLCLKSLYKTPPQVQLRPHLSEPQISSLHYDSAIMSANNNNNNDHPAPTEASSRPRRSSITSQTFTSLFNRSNSTSGPTPPFPMTISTAAAQEQQRRRMSVSTLGLSGTSPTQQSPFPFGGRRGSVSTGGSIDENAIDDDESPGQSNPTTPFARRMSFGAQALRSSRTVGGSPGTTGRSPSYTSSQLPTIPSGSRGGGSSGKTTPPKSLSQASTHPKARTPSDNAISARPGEGFNWSEQLRSRAESSVSQTQRPSFSASPPNSSKPFSAPAHERTRSVSEMPAPLAAIPPPAPARPPRKQPDAFQERILKGDFYMD